MGSLAASIDHEDKGQSKAFWKQTATAHKVQILTVSRQVDVQDQDFLTDLATPRPSMGLSGFSLGKIGMLLWASQLTMMRTYSPMCLMLDLVNCEILLMCIKHI